MAGIHHVRRRAGGGGKQERVAGVGGALVVDLVPNSGANPAGTYYTVVFQLDDVVRTEYWLLSGTSPTTIGAVRTTPGSGTTAQMVSRQYVDSAVAGKASDLSVVRLGGAETIAGTKLFSVSPTVPPPVASTDAVKKRTWTRRWLRWSRSFVAKNGDAMSGPLTLSGEKNDIRRSVYDRLVNAAIAVAISAAIAVHDHFGLK